MQVDPEQLAAAAITRAQMGGWWTAQTALYNTLHPNTNTDYTWIDPLGIQTEAAQVQVADPLDTF